MKKVLSIFLVICLLLSAVVTSTVMGSEATSYFEEPDNWVLNSDGENIDNHTGAVAPGSWATVTANTNATYVKEGSTSVKVYNNFNFTSIYLNDLKANTDYKLTYDYYVPTLYTTKAGVTYDWGIEYSGIFMPEFEGASAKKNKNGWLDMVSLSSGRSTPDGIYANGTDDTRKTSGITAGAWYSVEHSFNTADFGKLALLIKANAATLYLDNFALTEVSKPVTDNRAHNLIVNGDFANADNLDTTTKNYKGDASGFGKWINYNTGILNYDYSADGGVNGSGAAKATVPSTGYVRSFGQALVCDANTDYILTFKSKGNLNGKANGGVFKLQPCHATSEYAINVDAFTAITASEDWVEYTLKFNSGNRTSFWVGFGGMQNADPGLYYFIDDVALYKAGTTAKVSVTATEGGSVSGDGYYKRGGKVTLTATPDTGCGFEGWYLNDSLVSNELTLEVTASADGSELAYTAKFTPKTVDPDELIYDGGFDKTTTVASAESYDTVTYESAHIWYKPSSKSSITTDGTNKVLNLASWVYQSIKLNVNTTYSLKFKAKNTTDGLGITVYIRNLKNRSETVKVLPAVSIASDGEWAEYSLEFALNSIPASVTDLTLALHCGDGKSTLIDDLSLKEVAPLPVEKYSVTAVSDGGGTATVDKTVVDSGEEVTFTAAPATDFEFIGWFREGEDAAISTDAVYKMAVTENVKLHAKFSYNGVVDPDELLFDGGFNLTNSVVAAESYDTVTYESAHIWYRPPCSTSLVSEDGNNMVKLSAWLYQSVKIEANTNYVLKFRAKSNMDTTIQAMLRPIKNRAITLISTSKYDVAGDGAWKDYTLVVSVKSLFADYSDYALALNCPDGNNLLVDDISFKKITDDMASVSVSTFRGGTAKVDKTVVMAGDTATFTANPDAGNTFVGWYVKGSIYAGVISTDEVFTTAITEDTELLAVFGGDKYPANTYEFINPDAETGDTTGWNITGSSDASATGIESKYQYDGKHSFEVTTDESRGTIMSDNGILLKGNHRYTISMYLYNNGNVRLRPILSTSDSYRESVTDFVYQTESVFIRDDMKVTHTIGNDPPVERYFSSILFSKGTAGYSGAKDGWVKYVMEFDVLPQYDGTVVYLGIQCRTGTGDAGVDNVTVTEEPLNLDPQKSDMIYGEWVYNKMENTGFEDAVTDKNYGTLPEGFTVKSGGAYEGNKYLSIAANSGAYVKKLSLTRNEWFYINYVIKANTSGTSYIGIALEEPAADTDFADPEGEGIFAFYPTANGKWVRDGIKFVPQYNNNAYLIIYGGSNKLDIDCLELFAQKHARETDLNSPTLLPAYDYDNDVLYDEYDIKYANTSNENLPSGTSPVTGDKAYPLVAIFATLLLAFCGVVVSSKSKRRAK